MRTLLLEDNEKQFILKQKIGNGATCECYIGQNKNEETPRVFAIKIIPKKYYQFYINEITFLTKLKGHNNIIKLYGFGQGFLSNIENNDFSNNDKSKKEIIYYQILEYAENGELKDYVNGTNSRIPENIAARLFIRIVKVVKYLHDNNIAHCDLKPENILLDKFFIPKLIDFGFSQEFNGKKGDYLIYKKSGTPVYSSPDVRLAFTKGYDGIKNDIFALGVLLFVITIGDFPFESPTYSDEKYKFIIKNRYNQFWSNFSYINISEEFKDLINKLISITPNKRITTDEILKHQWIIKQLGLNYNDNEEIFDKEIMDELNTRKI